VSEATIAITPPDRGHVIESFAPLAKKLAARFRHWSIEPDDLIQLAMIAVCHAVDGFDPARGTKLCTYVWRYIEWELSDAVHAARRRTRPAGPLPFDLTDRSQDSASHADDNAEELWDAIDELPEPDRAILVSRYGLAGGEPMTGRQVATTIGRTRKTVANSTRRSRNTLRAALTA
jgi:RNA polymerase sigma factor (sigma-70 family)